MSEPGDPLTLLLAEPERAISSRTWMVAVAVVFVVAVIAAFVTFRRASPSNGAEQIPDRYANNLPISNLSMSEATNGAGGKAVYVDGTIANTGSRTLESASVQVTFQTAEGSAPYRETVPLQLVRTREPYVDLQPVSAAPLAPGQSRDFRLIFETIPDTWDVKPPSLRVIRAGLR